ncbi:PAS domain S-box protein [Sphingomonas canadensis]|uniref:histidine kinase n=1 Tax=Sphingomonas canadensis TaxID=1219257 RepID=A0ABW3HCN2_9SPHN|nr:PAS domain S-box protein [Sphingomonas canadensis]MCW3838239.1 PAS domain S-box protein [Sphingomonas canadensis]
MATPALDGLGMPLGDGLADLVPDSIIAFDADGIIRLWNRGAEQLFGWMAEEAIGQPADALLATSHPFGLSFIADALAADGEWSGELFRTTAGGRELYLSVRRILRRDAHGRGALTIEWARDAHQVSEGEISAHRFSNLFHAMAAAFWELDFSDVRKAIGGLVAAGETDIPAYLRANPDFIDRAIRMVRVIDVNEKVLEMYGLPSREVALAGPMDWAWPRESRWVFAESLVAAAERRDSFSVETAFDTWDGRRIDGLFTVCWPTDHKARGTVLVGVIDITDRKRAFQELEASEERYRTLFEHMPVALLQLDMQPLYDRLGELARAGVADLAAYVEDTPGFLDEVLMLPQIQEANIEGLRLLGVDSVEELRGPIVWAWRERPETIRRSLAARLRGERQYSEETVITRPDGTPVDVIYTMAFPPALMQRGFNVVGLVDISERKRAGEALRRSEERLRAIQAEFSHASRISTLGELTASIAHEVNQPLAAIAASGQASLRWLDRAEPDLAEVVALAGDIVADANRASDIIARIRGMAMKRDPDPRPLALNAMVEEALLIVRHEALGRDVAIETRFAEGLPPVSGDRVQLQQVVVNLALNAIQAIAGAGREERRVSVSTAAGAGDTVEILVRDSGPGIAPTDLGHLFTGFFTTKESGMGMGLAICRSIVQSHGGSIGAENVPGGACFRVTLPLAGG